MTDILGQILSVKLKELAEKKQVLPEVELISMITDCKPRVLFSESIASDGALHVIAEFKRKSPSKPQLNAIADVQTIPRQYEQAGASALSILTDTAFFGGTAGDLTVTRKATTLPVLRKDFIIDPYQVYESKMMGADLILLIAEALDANAIQTLTDLAHQQGLEVILELHSEGQLSKIPYDIDFIGINNRDLRSFETHIQSSLDLARYLPDTAHWISESGIHTAEQAHQLADAGYRIFLVGEQFMKTDDPGKACQLFVEQINAKVR